MSQSSNKFVLSAEQEAVLDALVQQYNVVVNSVAGSGKTSTMVSIAALLRHLRILILTFSKKLQVDTKKRAKREGLKVDVFTFHGFCKRFGAPCRDTKDIEAMLGEDPVPKPFKYDMVLLDEAQDMTPTFYRLVCKLIRDNGKMPQLGVFGDVNQCIFDYDDADSRFITMAPQIYPGKWKACDLSTSFRITREMARFVNDSLLGRPRLKAVKRGCKPIYVMTNSFDPENDVVDLVRQLLVKDKPNDIFILAQSVSQTRENRAPIHVLERSITSILKVPVYTPSKNGPVNPEVMEGKVAMLSFHQSKGLERKHVILIGFDESFNGPMVHCPNVWYVAATRATHQLIVVHHTGNHHLPFLRKHTLKDTTRMVQGLYSPKEKGKSQEKEVSVTSLVSRLTSSQQEECVRWLTIERNGVCEPIDMPHTMKRSNGMSEPVSHINGYAIPAMYEIMTTGGCSFLALLQKDLEDTYAKANEASLPKPHPKDVDPKTLSIPDLLFWATVYASFSSHYLNFVKQIDSFDWLDQRLVDICMHRLSHIKPSDFEIPIQREFATNKTIVGCLDCLDDHGTVYEFKCTGSLTTEHILQVAVYMWCMNKTPDPARTFKLLNVVTNEEICISCDPAKLDEMMEYMMARANGLNPPPVSDDNFLQCRAEERQVYTI